MRRLRGAIFKKVINAKPCEGFQCLLPRQIATLDYSAEVTGQLKQHLLMLLLVEIAHHAGQVVWNA
jgi:hypothetical protein